MVPEFNRKTFSLGVHWLASYPKSGNTWVRAFLDSYMFGRFDLNNLAFVTFDQKEQHYAGLSRKPVGDLTNPEKILLRPAALHGAACEWRHELGPFVMKTHALVLNDFIIPLRLTKPSVYLVRDPRDVCVSYSNHNERSIDETIRFMNDLDAALGKKYVTLPIGTWSTNIMSWIDKPDVLVVRYEDLIADPKEHFGRIVKHYGLPDTGRLESAIEATTFARLKKEEDKHGFTEKWGGDRFFRAGRPGGWEKALSDKQAKLIENQHRAMMIAHGYIEVSKNVRIPEADNAEVHRTGSGRVKANA